MDKEVEELKQCLDEMELSYEETEITFKQATCITVVTKYFIIFWHEEFMYISFNVGASLYDASYYTLMLSGFENLCPFPECFGIDDKIVFGDTATKEYDKYNKNKMRIKKCPVCDRYLPNEYFNDDNGFCITCNEYTLNTVTFH